VAVPGSPAEAIALALSQIEEADPALPPEGLDPPLESLIDLVLDRTIPASDKPALLFLLAYKVLNPDHDISAIPRGWRPADKQLCAALTEGGYTLHSNVTAFGENMGTKGQADRYNFFERPRTGQVLEYIANYRGQLAPALSYIAWRFKKSHTPPVRIEPLGSDELTFTRAYAKAHKLIFTESGGHFPQFLVAALLRALHEQWGTQLRVVTHHPHASDTSDRTAGDLELFDERGEIVDAFEVTIRPDWKNRRPDLLKKMAAFGLSRYHVICFFEGDVQLSNPESLDAYMSELGQDISVVDIRAFTASTLMSLTRQNRVRVFELLEGYIRDRQLSGVPEYVAKLKQIVEG
jgi:hypothetical protein